MPKPKSGKKRSPKRILALPDLEHAKTACCFVSPLNAGAAVRHGSPVGDGVRSGKTYTDSRRRVGFSRT